MSRAFVNEDSNQPEELPEIPQSSNPGYITSAGLARLRAELNHLETVDRPPLEAAIAAGSPDGGSLHESDSASTIWRRVLLGPL